MIKRILAALLLMTMILPGLLACGSSDTGPLETGTETTDSRPETGKEQDSETSGRPDETAETGSGADTEASFETDQETETAPETDPIPEPAGKPTMPNYLKASSVIRENTWNVNGEEAGTAFIDPSQAKTYSSEKIQSFWIRTQENERIPFSVACHIAGGCISAILPAGIES